MQASFGPWPWAVFLLLWITACEEAFIPETPPAQNIVVEGYIEGGQRPSAPFVILTRSVPFFAELNAEELDDIFVHDAEVIVDDGSRSVRLEEICLGDLSPAQRRLAAELFGFAADSIGFNFCAYTDITGEMRGEAGRQYDLSVRKGEQELRASTTIPSVSDLDSLKFEPPPGEANDTLMQLNCIIDDPGGVVNFYRYQTQINDEGFRTPLGSVIDDRLFDGQRFDFVLPKAEPRDADFDLETFGLYRRGDTVTLKWMGIDRAHFDFWNTLEFSVANQGPFSSYTRVNSNIEGGLGVWGGQSARYYTLPVPEE